MLKNILDKVVSGSATIAWKADGKLREFMHCDYKHETEEFIEGFKEQLHHIAHCHVCKMVLVKALKDMPDIKEVKHLTAGE
jgi:hypothetical protein